MTEKSYHFNTAKKSSNVELKTLMTLKTKKN